MTRTRVAIVSLAAGLSAAALTAAASPSLANPVVAPGQVVKVSDDYLTAQCKLVLTGTDASGNTTSYLTAQSNGTVLGYGMVKSTSITCSTYGSSYSTVLSSLTANASGPSVPNSRRNATLPAQPAYHVCAVVTEFLYTNGTSRQLSACA